MTLFEAQTGGAFDRLNWQHSGEFDQNFSKKSNAPGGGGGAWAVLELTGTIFNTVTMFCKIIKHAHCASQPFDESAVSPEDRET